MSESIDDRLLDYYQRELAYLRNAGARFAREHPGVARRLCLNERESPDPHVERLLEGFALLTARVQRQIDDGHQVFAEMVLEQLYPYALRPIPSVGTLRFEADPARPELAGGYVLPRDSALFATTGKGQSVRMRTTSEVTLWPLRVAALRLVPIDELSLQSCHPAARSALIVRIESSAGPALGSLSLLGLRFHLGGSPREAAWLFDALVSDARSMVVRSVEQPRGRPLPGLPRACGFGDDEAIYPLEEGVHPALRLLAEYCACAEKFAYVRIPVQIPPETGRWLELVIELATEPDPGLVFSPDDMQLGCTPVVNLFPLTSDPLRPDGTRREYRLVGDAYREAEVEIHAIRRVFANDGKDCLELPPDIHLSSGEGFQPPSWHARRVVASGSLRGSDMMLTIVDPCCRVLGRPGVSLSAEVLCTSRHCAESLQAGSMLSFERPGLVVRAVMSRAPTPQRDVSHDGASRWRLVAQLWRPHLPLDEGSTQGDAAEQMRQILIAHACAQDHGLLRRIDGIVGVSGRPVCARAGRDAWRGWRNGLEVCLRLDPDCFAGSSRVLFAGVLAHFFGLYANVNQFVRTVLDDREGVVGSWSGMTEAG